MQPYLLSSETQLLQHHEGLALWSVVTSGHWARPCKYSGEWITLKLFRRAFYHPPGFFISQGLLAVGVVTQKGDYCKCNIIGLQSERESQQSKHHLLINGSPFKFRIQQFCRGQTDQVMCPGRYTGNLYSSRSHGNYWLWLTSSWWYHDALLTCERHIRMSASRHRCWQRPGLLVTM